MLRNLSCPNQVSCSYRAYQKCLIAIDLCTMFTCVVIFVVFIVCVEHWFSVDEKEPIAFVNIEFIEGADMQPSDLNGLFFAL